VTPDTIMRWHRQLIAAKWTHSSNRVGRPGIMKAIRALIVRMATDNSSWSYCRIQGELRKLNHRVAPSTIAKTLKEHGIPTSRKRPSSWRTFLRPHAGVIAAADFFTFEVWTPRGLVPHSVLFVIHRSTRAIQFAGVTTNPNSEFMAQVARNLTDCDIGFLRGKRYLIIDRDILFAPQFKGLVEGVGIDIVLTAYRALNMNAYAERFVRSIKSECLNKMIFVGQASLDHAVSEFVIHYHDERPHQGLVYWSTDFSSPFRCHNRLPIRVLWC